MEYDCIETAKRLHDKYFVADTHFDLLPLVLDRRQRGESRVI